MLYENLSSAKSIKEKTGLIFDFYQKRRLEDSHEPLWTHKAYEIIKQYLDDELKKEDLGLLYEIIKSHMMPDGAEVPAIPNVPSSPVRIMHERWKIGTPTWIFMGRSLTGSTRQITPKWIAVKREIPEKLSSLFDPQIPTTIWLAYNLDKQMGLDEKNSNCIGPTLYFDKLVDEVVKNEK